MKVFSDIETFVGCLRYKGTVFIKEGDVTHGTLCYKQISYDIIDKMTIKEIKETIKNHKFYYSNSD